MRKDYDNEKQAVKETLFPNGTGDMSKTEIALAIHDYIALHTRYDHAAVAKPSENPNMFNAYGALVNGLAVCHGYALAYMDLLSRKRREKLLCILKEYRPRWLIIETERDGIIPTLHGMIRGWKRAIIRTTATTWGIANMIIS